MTNHSFKVISDDIHYRLTNPDSFQERVTNLQITKDTMNITYVDKDGTEFSEKWIENEDGSINYSNNKGLGIDNFDTNEIL
jgi:hypothetical protein